MDDQERRIETRLQEEVTIFVEMMPQDEQSQPTVIICNSIDLSANGLQVQLDDPVKIGTILRLCVDFHDNEDPIYLIGEVKWTTEKDAQHFVGFELYDAENSNIIDWKHLIASKLSLDIGD